MVSILYPPATPEQLGTRWNSLLEARVVFGDFKHEHNHQHQHSAPGSRSQSEYAAACRHTRTPTACEIKNLEQNTRL
jgi:hypothetical protein